LSRKLVIIALASLLAIAIVGIAGVLGLSSLDRGMSAQTTPRNNLAEKTTETTERLGSMVISSSQEAWRVTFEGAELTDASYCVSQNGDLVASITVEIPETDHADGILAVAK
jgi:hypothetical protein